VRHHGDGREDENPSGLGLGREGLKNWTVCRGKGLKDHWQVKTARTRAWLISTPRWLR
jgi:hypothetical protein